MVSLYCGFCFFGSHIYRLVCELGKTFRDDVSATITKLGGFFVDEFFFWSHSF